MSTPRREIYQCGTHVEHFENLVRLYTKKSKSVRTRVGGDEVTYRARAEVRLEELVIRAVLRNVVGGYGRKLLALLVA